MADRLAPPASGRIVYQARLAFAIAAAMVPAAILALVLLGYDSYERGRDRHVRDSTATARALAAAVDAELLGVRSALFALATSPYLASNDLAAFHRQASAALEGQLFSNIVLFDADLRQRMNTLRPFGAALPLEQNTMLKRAVAEGAPVFMDLIQGRVAGRPLTGVAVPVRANGAVRYVLSAGIFPERLAGVLTQQRLPASWVAVILDGTGTVVARTHDPERFVGGKASATLVQQAARAAEGHFDSATLEGIPVLTVFSRAPASGWTVAIGIPRSEMLRELWLAVARLGIVGFLLLGSALGAAIYIGGRLDRGAAR